MRATPILLKRGETARNRRDKTVARRGAAAEGAVAMAHTVERMSSNIGWRARRNQSEPSELLARGSAPTATPACCPAAADIGGWRSDRR